MSDSGGLTATPLQSDLSFNWVFLVILLVSGIVTLFFLYYFNRVFAALVSLLLRWYTWKWYRVYIDIQALQISLLGGRIFFKGIRYHGNNETILIHNGYVTWSYWLRNVRELDLRKITDTGQKCSPSDSGLEESDHVTTEQGLESGVGGGSPASQAKLPCRIKVVLQGAEWFVYNRSAAYDAIIAATTHVPDDHSHEDVKDRPTTDAEMTAHRRRPNTKESTFSQDTSVVPDPAFTPRQNLKSIFAKYFDKLDPRKGSTTRPETSDKDAHSFNDQNLPLMLKLLPVHIECKRAAVVLGNENTKSVLITKVDSATGEIDASGSGALDEYKQLYNFRFQHPVVQMKPNDDYKEDQKSTAIKARRGQTEQCENPTVHAHKHSYFHRQRRKAWHRLQDMVPAFRSSVDSFSSGESIIPATSNQNIPGAQNWQGLSRYLDESEKDDKAKWATVEYATVSTIIDCPEATMSFYWDAVGRVALSPDQHHSSERQMADINGDVPPEWGIKLSLKGGTINYGPWADRQRADIQQVFFPSLCKDASPAQRLSKGQLRVPTEFKLYIELDEETILRVPIKEESKNWKWAKQVDAVDPLQSNRKKTTNKSRKRVKDKGSPGAEVRPFGWLDIKVGSNATIRYEMDMVARAAGFSNKLELDLPSVEITTSVNHGLLLRSLKTQISCDLSNPLQWNGHHSWIFDVKASNLELFILREHVFLLTDLVDDWASGPPPEYLTFSPFQYLVNIHLSDFRIFLNVNDANIINNPSDLDDNTYIIIFGSVLDADVSIPLDKYRPHRNDISFNVQASTGGLNLHVPPWNTQATFLTSQEIATLQTLAIQGKYQYCATTSTSNTDTLLLNVHGLDPTAQIYGFVIRYYLKVKDNYFGDDIRFKTLEEYQEVLRQARGETSAVVVVQPFKKSNDLDVILSIGADNCAIILPGNLYSTRKHTRIEIASLTADLRFTNYYMDLDVIFNTLALSQTSAEDDLGTPLDATSSTQVFIDGVRAAGNRLFGLPPTEPTYVCNWDFDVGAITGECSTDFLSCLANGVQALAFSFDDDENALPLILEAALHDVTFLRASIDSVRVWLHVDESAFLFSTGNLDINFNDWAGSHYSGKMNLKIPDICLACVDAESASRHRSRTQHRVETYALIHTSISVTMIERKLDFAENRKLQQEHIQRHDQRTHRTSFLLHEGSSDDSVLVPVDPPAMCVPPMPLVALRSELIRESESLSTDTTTTGSSQYRGSRPIVRKGSFLSISGSSQGSHRSVARGKNSRHAREHAPMKSRSRSVHTSTRYSTQFRDVSASTGGRRSSFYSAVGEHKGFPQSSVAFSSSFIAPYFPLESVEPDQSELPPAPSIAGQKADLPNNLGLGDIDTSGMDDMATHVSIIVELPSGITGVFSPKAVTATAGLLTALQPNEPNDILDHLQMESIGNIFDIKKENIKTGKVMDCNIRTQGIHVRLINSTQPTSSHSYQQDIHDQYDLSVLGLSVMIRSKTTAADSVVAEGARDTSALHLSLMSASFSAKERIHDMDDTQVAVNSLVEDLVCWAATGDDNSASVVLKAIEITTASSKVEYLATLVHRTTLLAENLEDTFVSLERQTTKRVQLFTYLVAVAGQNAPDPPFLTRPSYVLRSASAHLRTTDSWKVVTRFHQMYASLDSAKKYEIAMRCLDNTEALPRDAKQRIKASFTSWRGWDLNDIHKCMVMGKLYGTVEETANASPVPSLPERPLRVSFRTETARLLLDPGPKQNEVSLALLTATVESKAVTLSSGDEIAYVQRTLVQIFCSDAAINFNWELCELVGNILKLWQQPESPAESSQGARLTSEKKNVSGKRHSMQLIVATERGSVAIHTINIRAVSISKGLKASIIMTDDLVGDLKTVSTIMIAADAATSRLKSRSQDLTICQIRKPSIYISHEGHSLSGAPNNIFKVAGNCQELKFVVHQDLQALVEVLDLIIGDEVAQIHDLTKIIMPKKSPAVIPSPDSRSSINKINVALFLDMYQISIPLLQSLIYNVSGTVARASLSAHLGSEIVFDFDVKEHEHDVQTNINDKKQSISLLQMPPINGRITTHMSHEETCVSVFTSVEPVELDAAAIHNLLTAINRPEIASVLSDIQEDISTVQRHIDQIFGTEKKHDPSISKVKKELVYDIHLTLAGFDVFANAKSGDFDRKTRLDFNLGCVQLVLVNRLEQHGPILQYPEIRIGLRQIVVELARWNHESMESCGSLSFAAFLTATSKINESGASVRSFHLNSDGLEINVFSKTATAAIDIIGHLQNKIKDLDLSREKNYFRKLRKSKPRLTVNNDQASEIDSPRASSIMFASMYSLELLNIQISWLMGDDEVEHTTGQESENLVLSLNRVDLSTRKENSARLTIEDLQLQMVPLSHNKSQRSLNSALLPEVIFNVGYVSLTDTRRLAFQAACKSLDLRLTSQFIIPAAELQRSISAAADKVRMASTSWVLPSSSTVPHTTAPQRKPFFGKKRMESLLVDADFAGAVVYLSGKRLSETPIKKTSRSPQAGKYGQFTHSDSNSNTVLRSPGLACKVEYKDSGIEEPSLNAEVKVDASSNTLYPAVVPLIMEITSAVKEMVSDEEEDKNDIHHKVAPQKFMSADEDNILTADPSTVLGKTRLNLGLRICRQEFSLSCQPIARVAATARFEDIYLTINTVRSIEHGHFFAISAAITKLQASVQHVYSRESTGSFDVDRVFLSLMNSKHVSGTSGVSAILKISPMKALVNAKQIQDFLLFREIWVPVEIRQSQPAPDPVPASTTQSQKFLVQRYQQVAATGAFPWNATVSIEELHVQLDLGQALGKSSFVISNFWISSRKNSDWEQNLCLGFDKVGVDSTGRMSGYIALQDFRLRTSIQWPAREMALNQTPLVQGSLVFSQLRIKAAFDYQAFLVGDITSFKFMMYNIRNGINAKGDRLVASLDGDSVQVFCTTNTASQALALYQAFLRLVEEKRTNYEASLSEIENFMKRKSVTQPAPSSSKFASMKAEDKPAKSPISLHTDVIVTLKAVNMGAFPNTFSEQQVFKLEALNAQARFAVSLEDDKVHSSLGLTLGQVRIGLAGVKRISAPKTVGEISVEDVIDSATGSRGGTILKVPKLKATMQTWHLPNSNHIDYVFKSSFEGKVEVGWNYSRISYIRGMWAAHSKSLALRLGKPLPPSAVKITGVPGEATGDRKEGEQQKITAEVNVPLSKYSYTALEPPIIETPQLKDMGEATPPLEWIGLHRERLPNITHQIVIVTLLELASEVEDAYAKILGSS